MCWFAYRMQALPVILAGFQWTNEAISNKLSVSGAAVEIQNDIFESILIAVHDVPV